MHAASDVGGAFVELEALLGQTELTQDEFARSEGVGLDAVRPDFQEALVDRLDDVGRDFTRMSVQFSHPQ